MADMPKMQEHFSAAAMDGRHAENAGAFFGRSCRSFANGRATLAA
jgi:hypothetical protein